MCPDLWLHILLTSTFFFVNYHANKILKIFVKLLDRQVRLD